MHRGHVEPYIRQLGDRGLMPSTITTMMHAIRGHFRYAQDSGHPATSSSR
jgi:hypothetical protein